MRKLKHFTLIELLIVVAILAILIAMLLPSLSKAREQVRKVQCLNNMRHIFLYCFQYCDEFDNSFIASLENGTDPPKWWSGFVGKHFYVGGTKNTNDFFYRKPGDYGGTPILTGQCPTTLMRKESVGVADYNSPYDLNTWLGFNMYAAFSVPSPHSHTVKPFLSVPGKTSSYIFLTEAYKKVCGLGTYPFHTVNGSDLRLNVHFNGRNIIFMDGHGDSMNIKDYTPASSSYVSSIDNAALKFQTYWAPCWNSDHSPYDTIP